MTQKLLLFAVLALALACTKSSESKKAEKLPEGTDVVREYFSNGKVKTEIRAINGLRQGPTRNYDRDGMLLSEVNYVDNMKDGMATNYYAKTGKVNSTLVYKKGIKEGDENYYYENGQVYRISPYVAGKIDGVQKLFYDDGKPLAEVPYKQGYAGKGTREFRKDGSVITDYPDIYVKKELHLKDANKVLLIISLTNNKSQVKFYTGELLDGKYLHENLLTLATQGGTTQIDFNIPPGATIRKTIHLVANYKSPLQNPVVLTKTYQLEATNN